MISRLCGIAALALLLAAAGAQGQEGSAARLSGLKLSGDQPIQIESDRLEVRDTEGVAVFTGNVQVVQGQTLLKSGRMTVYYARDAEGGKARAAAPDGGAIERIDVDGKVYVRTETQVATADAASFDLVSELLVMTGKEVVLSDSGNVIVGCRLTVQMATGQAKLDGCGEGNRPGRVKMLLQPKSQTQ